MRYNLSIYIGVKRACQEYQTDDKVIKYKIKKHFFPPPTTTESAGAIYGLGVKLLLEVYQNVEELSLRGPGACMVCY